MRLRLLRHSRGLGMAPPSALPPLAPSALDRASGSAALVTFRAPFAGAASPEIVDATSRPFASADVQGDVHVHGLEQDSPLAPLLLWDLAHGLPIGARLVLDPLLPGAAPHWLQRAYFAPHLHLEPAEIALVLRKVSALPVETERGLDAWSFCIPVGPEEATLLNLVVERVLALDIPRKEILLCGRPGPGFAHADAVRIVGEDLPATGPVNISRKKNRLAKEATHPNLCIFHDRVLLPRDFAAAIARFGDDYPLVAFQSLWFDDRWGLVPRRYSDLGIVEQPVDRHVLGLPRGGGVPSAFAPTVLDHVERTGFACAHPQRHVPDRSFINGSLCIAKRAAWLACPQDERLLWTEFEDVEHGLRAGAMGIPSRCNPFALTVSLTARPILSLAGAVRSEGRDGRLRSVRAPLEPLPIPRKPLIKLSMAEAEQRLARFVEMYLPAGLPVLSGGSWRGRHGAVARLEAVIAAVAGATLPRTAPATAQFVTDWEKLILLDQVGFHRRKHLAERLLAEGVGAKRLFLEDSYEFLNMVAQRPSGPLFFHNLSEFLPEGRRRWRVTPAIAAMQLAVMARHGLHHPEGWRGFYRALRAVWP